MTPTDAELFYPGPSEAPATKPADPSSVQSPHSIFPEKRTASGDQPTAGDPSSGPQQQQPPKSDAELFYPQPAETEPPASEPGVYDLQMPEGVTVDTDLLTAATPVLRDLGLSNEQASKLAPLATIVQERMVSEMANEHAQMRADWIREAKADANIGGAKWDETIKIASGALTQCGAGPGSDVRKLLDDSGLGNHPAFIRLFRNVGLQLSSAGRDLETGLSREQQLYLND